MKFTDLFKPNYGRPLPEKKEVKPLEKMPIAKPTSKNFNVTGTSHYVDNIMKLAIPNPNYKLTKKDLIAKKIMKAQYEYIFKNINVELIAEPDNQYDPNAIKVVVSGEHIGYIKAGNCSQVKNIINAGRVNNISIDIYGGKYKGLIEYGDDDYELESDTSEYRATVHVDLKE